MQVGRAGRAAARLRPREGEGARVPLRLRPEGRWRRLARMERFPHIKGKWARNGERIRLQPWQCFIVACIFGWKRKRDGLRRFREAYIECPRKNAKSIVGALFGIEMFAYDGEHGSEVYSGAGSEKQAHEVFGPAKLMLERSPEIREEAGVEVWSKALVRPEDN